MPLFLVLSLRAPCTAGDDFGRKYLCFIDVSHHFRPAHQNCATDECMGCILKRLESIETDLQPRVYQLEGQMKPTEIIKDATDKFAIYPLSDKEKIDKLLALDKV